MSAPMNFYIAVVTTSLYPDEIRSGQYALFVLATVMYITKEKKIRYYGANIYKNKYHRRQNKIKNI